MNCYYKLWVESFEYKIQLLRRLRKVTTTYCIITITIIIYNNNNNNNNI